MRMCHIINCRYNKRYFINCRPKKAINSMLNSYNAESFILRLSEMLNLHYTTV